MAGAGTRCLCCSSRTCLVIWSALLIVGTVSELLLAGPNERYIFRGAQAEEKRLHFEWYIITLLADIVLLIVGISVLIATVTEKYRMLKIAFSVAIGSILPLIILAILRVKTFADYINASMWSLGSLALILTYTVIIVIFQGGLAWVVKRTMHCYYTVIYSPEYRTAANL